MADPKIAITVVVNGEPTVISANPHAPLRSIVEKALEESGNVGQPPENWEMHDQAGDLLDLDRKVESFGFADGARLFLNLKAGIGGQL